MQTRSDLIGTRSGIPDPDKESSSPILAAFDLSEDFPHKDRSIAPKVLLVYVRAEHGLIVDVRLCAQDRDATRMGCFWFVDRLTDANSDENGSFHWFAKYLGCTYAILHALVQQLAPAQI